MLQSATNLLTKTRFKQVSADINRTRPANIWDIFLAEA